ncbi:MAG: heme o synthase [Rubrivivax sp.]|nr:heme o synthase [Rubrivivax sp.]MBP6466234.1 heme o synthase [Rubrivivax sp.]
MNRSAQPAVLPGASSAARTHAPAVARWRTVLGVFKLRISVLIMATALGGLFIVPDGSVAPLQALVLALSVLLASASAGAFNQFVEADSDRLMARTRTRAFASGALPRSKGWLLAIVALLVFAVSLSAVFVNFAAAGFVLLGALTYAGVYTLGLKRRTPWNIVIGGLAGSFAVLAGAAAVNPQIGPLAALLALVLFLWTPPHFWSLAIANEAQYAAAGVPMLPVVVGAARAARIVHASTIALVAVSLLLVFFGAGWIVFVGALIGGVHFLRKTHALVHQPDRRTAMAAFFASMVQLSALLAAVVIDAALR